MTGLAKFQLNPVNELNICRICGEESEQGQILFNFNQDIQKLAVEICSYISIKLKYIRIYPNWICPGCQLQFESTHQFFELIRIGQSRICEEFGAVPKKERKSRRKPLQITEVIESTVEDKASEETTEEGRKRPIKTPGRLQDSMQGNELEELYTDMGVTRRASKRRKKSQPKLIAHIENTDGATLGEMLTIPRNPTRTCTRYMCDICKEKFVHDATFFQHVATHKNIQYECTECEKSFPLKISFDEHQELENHKGLGIIETPFVETPEATENAAPEDGQPTDAHIKSPKKPPAARFVCSKCNKSFLTKSSMKRHQVTHSQNRPYKCDICSAAFKQKSILLVHKTSHTGERSFKCHKCPKSFVHRQTLKAHLRSHDGLKPYLCVICKKSFFQLGALQEHKRIHTGERPFVCLICGTSFKTSSQCRVHQRGHNAPGDTAPPPTPFENIHKSHTCKTCGKLFSQRSAMVKHVRTHTGEKPYHCHLCPKSFADPSNFKKHKSLHAAQSEKAKVVFTTIPDQSLTHVSSNSDPDPDGLLSTNSQPSDNFKLRNHYFMDILEEDNDRNSKAWGLLQESLDPIITEIHNDDTVFMQQQQTVVNQLACVSYPDPMNPISNKTTFYVVN